jgi:hypothetical protein
LARTAVPAPRIVLFIPLFATHLAVPRVSFPALEHGFDSLARFASACHVLAVGPLEEFREVSSF